MFEEYNQYAVLNEFVACILTNYGLFFEEWTFVYHKFSKNNIAFMSYIRHT
jgi:hypothetical protein